MSRLPSVRTHMDTDVRTFSPDMPILDAIDALISWKVTGAPVVDGQFNVLGILTEKDCLQVLAKGTDADLPTGVVSDYMQRKVVSITPDMNIYYAAGIFLNHNFRRLPVMVDGKLVGAITRFDILRAVSANHRLVLG